MLIFASMSRDKNTGKFLPGYTYREPKLLWDKEWIKTKYFDEKLSVTEIGELCGCTHKNVSYWLKKHGFKGRTVSEVRRHKYWGSKGDKNPMFGKTGEENPQWKGGVTPERQRFYSSMEWRALIPVIFKRDDNKCRRCGKQHETKRDLHIHHIIPFKFKEFRTVEDNLMLLCQKCHGWVHSKKNINKEYLSDKH